jgi:hypothetical protein
MSERKITPEIMKAETALSRHDKAYAKSLETHTQKWQAKRFALVNGLPVEVASALVALKVLDGQEVQDAAEFAQGGP